MAKNAREYKQDERNRDYYAKEVEKKHRERLLSGAKESSVSINEKNVKELETFTTTFELSKRSRSLLINHLIERAFLNIQPIVDQATEFSRHRGAEATSEIKGLALEVILLGGAVADFNKAFAELMEKGELKAKESADQTVHSGNTPFTDLTALQHLRKG